MSHVHTPEGFLADASDLIVTLRALAKDGPHTLARCLMAGHCLETTLKAHLLQSGFTEGQLRKVGHDLENAWRLTVQHGLPFSADPPSWVAQLAGTHGSPYPARYPKTNTGIVVPGVATLSDYLQEVVEAVRIALAAAN